jgi:hypothetical protein
MPRLSIPEALLTSSIPDLQLNGGAVNVNSTDFLVEIKSNYNVSKSIVSTVQDLVTWQNVRNPHRWWR